MTSTLNTVLFSSMVKSKRGGKVLREVSEEIGSVSPATLSRIEQGKVPDVDTFIKICDWLNVSTDSFTIKTSDSDNQVSNQDLIIAHLRSDRELPTDTVEMIVKLVDLAYSKKM